ncbi:MAG TPA: hypothetical protein VM286_06700 [Candidatus Thermoplasmatota archaeon]|nr:hypothetical protein [Candidatus Thermoplasmatota archaeon]
MPLPNPRTSLRRAAIALAAITAVLVIASPAMAATQPPKAPKQVTCTAQGDGVHVTWAAVTGATSYNVWRKVGNNGAWIMIGSTTTTGYVDSTAASGQLYHYAASSVGAGGESDRGGTCNVVSIPFFPSNLALGAATVGGLGLTLLVFRRKK